MVTSNLVAKGSGFFASGVKMSVVVPDQRNAPGTAGEMWNHGGLTSLGILPTTTIGSEKTTRISFASARVATSPMGPALMMVSLSSARAATARKRKTKAASRFMARSVMADLGRSEER